MTHTPLNGLKARREFAKLSTTDLAPVVDVTQSHYVKIENGKVRLDVHRAYLLARRLGCTIEELL